MESEFSNRALRYIRRLNPAGKLGKQLVFGKAHFSPPDFSAEVQEDYEREAEEAFGEHWDLVGNLLFKLELMGIWYLDANLRNINCKGLK